MVVPFSGQEVIGRIGKLAKHGPVHTPSTAFLDGFCSTSLAACSLMLRGPACVTALPALSDELRNLEPDATIQLFSRGCFWLGSFIKATV